MSDFTRAVAVTLRNEGGFFHNPVTGEVVNHGITLRFVRTSGYKPDADESFIRNLTPEEATEIYQRHFWNRYHIGLIQDQNLAGKAFDLTVNMGPKALELLQSAVNACGGACEVDGVLGPHSLAQINSLDPVELLARFKETAARHYREIAAAHAELSGNLTGWLARLSS
jgi:lysozyme family protein